MAKLCIALGLCAAAAFFSLSQFAVPRDREENRRQLSSLLSRFAVSKKVKEWALRSPLFQPPQDKLGAASFLSQLGGNPGEQEDQDTTTTPALDWFATATQGLRLQETTSVYETHASPRLSEHETEPSAALTFEEETVSPEIVERQQEGPLLSLNKPVAQMVAAPGDLALYETTERAVEVPTMPELMPNLPVNENKRGNDILTSPSPTHGQEEDETEVLNSTTVITPKKPELDAGLNRNPPATHISSFPREQEQDATVVSLSSSVFPTESPDLGSFLTQSSFSQRSSLPHDKKEEITTISGISSGVVNEQPEFNTAPNTEPSVSKTMSSMHVSTKEATISDLHSVFATKHPKLDVTLNTERSFRQKLVSAHVQGEGLTTVSNFLSVHTPEEAEHDVTPNSAPSLIQMTSSLEDEETTTFSSASPVHVYEPHEAHTTQKTELSLRKGSVNATPPPLFSEAATETAYLSTASSRSSATSGQEGDNIATRIPSSALPYQETDKITTSTVSTEIGAGSEQKYTTTTEPAIEEPPGPKLLCYFTSWSLYRNGSGRFTPEDVDAKLCTHIIYAFASLNSSTLKIAMSDPWADADNELYKRATALKASNRKLRVLLSLGGWGDSGGSDDKYSRLAANDVARRDFALDAANFLKTYRFDGLDIDWEYPNCASGFCSSNPPDVENFALLLEDLREAFDAFSPPLLLSATLSGNIEVIEEAYNVPAIFRQVDFASVMAYDYYGPWSSTTGHYAPFQAAMDETNPEISIEYVVNALIAMGAPVSQLVLGVPFYARSFTLANPRKNTIGAPISGAGKPGIITDTVGLLAYYEICSAIKAGGWTTMMDPDAGVYAYSGDQWVCFDGPRSIMRKARFALRRGLAGLMAWDLSMDDFHGVCGRPNPLLNAARRGLYPPAARGTAAGSG